MFRSRLKEIRDDYRYAKARKRLARQTPLVVTDWSMSSIWALQEAIEAYQRTFDRAALVEAETAVILLQAGVDVLLDKHQDPVQP